MAGDVRLLRVNTLPTWKAGQVVACAVPENSSPDCPPPGPHRTLYVTVPRDAGAWFYVRYRETEEGTPILESGDERVSAADQPILSTPVIVPASAVLVKRKRSMWHQELLLTVVLPLVVYAAAIPTLFSWEIPGIPLILQVQVGHYLAIAVGCWIVYWRYKNSVVGSEFAIHVFCLIICIIVLIFLVIRPLRSELVHLLAPDFYKAYRGWEETKGSNKYEIYCWLYEGYQLAIEAPIGEEIVKYLVPRFVAFRGIVVDHNAIIAYGLCAGLAFGLYENIYYVATITGWWRFVRVGGVLFHTCSACMSACRLARWRFLGKPKGMWSCIYFSILIHALHNGGAWGYTYAEHYGWLSSTLISLPLLIGILIVPNAIAVFYTRKEILRTDKIKGVDLKQLLETGQVVRRPLTRVLADSLCWCSSSRKGILRSSGRTARPVEYESTGRSVRKAKRRSHTQDMTAVYLKHPSIHSMRSPPSETSGGFQSPPALQQVSTAYQPATTIDLSHLTNEAASHG